MNNELKSEGKFLERLKNGETTVICKSSIKQLDARMFNLLLYLSIYRKRKIAVFTERYNANETFEKLTALISKVDIKKIQKGTLNKKDWPKITKASELLKKANIFISDSHKLNPKKIAGDLQKLKKQHGNIIGFIDYYKVKMPIEDLFMRLSSSSPLVFFLCRPSTADGGLSYLFGPVLRGKARTSR